MLFGPNLGQSACLVQSIERSEPGIQHGLDTGSVLARETHAIERPSRVLKIGSRHYAGNADQGVDRGRRYTHGPADLRHGNEPDRDVLRDVLVLEALRGGRA